MRNDVHRLFVAAAVLLMGFATKAPSTAQQAISVDPRVRDAIGLATVWLDAEQAYGNIPGMSVAIVHDQEVVWEAGFGYADLQAGTLTVPETLYRACSIIKPFTATAVMQLKEAKALHLDDPVREHLSWFSLAEGHTDGISVEALLTHSSGLPRDLPYSYWTGPDYPFPAREQLTRDVPGLSLAVPPRTRMLYSNVGMTLAGEVVTAASGADFDEYVRNRIFIPLGMADSHVDVVPGDDAYRLATGYTVQQRHGSREEVPSYRVRALAPAAGLISTVQDLARFASWQFRLMDTEAPEVLSRQSLREMHRIQWMEPDGWSRSGYGYQTWAENDRHFVGHAGACPGYESKLLMRLPERIAVVLMVNAQGPPVDAYAQRLYDLFAPAVRTAQRSTSTEISWAGEAGIEALTGVYRRPLGGEHAVLKWRDGIAVLSLPASNPARALEVYEAAGEGVFRRVGSGDSDEVIRFDQASSGRVRMWRTHQYSIRAGDLP